MTGNVSCVVEQSLAIVTFDNSARLNAIDQAIAGGLATVTAELSKRDDVNAILLRGAGTKAFSAGVDLKAADASGNREAAFAGIDFAMQEVEANIAATHVPIVAMLSGVCYGGGVQLASLADFRIAGRDLKLSVPAVANRLFYPIPAIERLAGIVGWQTTRRLILESVPVGADALAAWGFVDHVVDAGEIEAAAVAFAQRLADKPREIVSEYVQIFAALERGDTAAAQTRRQDAKAREQARRLAKK